MTLIDSKHSNIDNDVKIKPNKRYHTAKDREIITEEDIENEEMKEGGHKDESKIRGK